MSQAHSNTTLGGSALEDRIAAAFVDGATSAAGIASLIEEAESAALASSKSAEHARERALDPTLRANAVVGARRQMEDSAFEPERLQTAVSQLREQPKEVRAQEEVAVGMDQSGSNWALGADHFKTTSLAASCEE